MNDSIRSHPLYDLCYSAHRNTSHVPEKRAEQEIAAYQSDLDVVTAHNGDVHKVTVLFKTWMAAKSRCASSMITGPANFNVRRNQKANASEEKHGRAYHDYIERVQRPRAQTQNRIVSAKTAAFIESIDTLHDGVAAPYIIDKEGKRVFFEFADKPSETERDLLKRNGFKWTPSKNHWGRLLTENAVSSAKRVAVGLNLAAIKDEPACAGDAE